MVKRVLYAILLAMFLGSLVCPQFNMSLIARVDATEEHTHHYFSDNTGTYFEVNTSEHLNVTITSTETVRIVLAVPFNMIDYIVEPVDGVDSTTLTLSNLQPSTTYYMYEDSCMNEFVFATDSEGSYTYIQDLSQRHRVFIQPTPSTTYICEDTTLTSNIIGSVVICANNIVLDLNGYSIISTGKWSGVGISILGKTGVTVKNGIVDWFYEGVQIGSGNTVEGVTIRNCFFGILFPGNYNIIRYNNIENSWSHGIGMWYSTGNEIYCNTLSNNQDDGIFLLWTAGGNRFLHNNFINNYPAQAESWLPRGEDIWDDGYPSGGNYWCDYTGGDACCGPNQDQPGSDGIGDTRYFIPDASQDNYPLMRPWTPPVAATVDIDPDTLNLKSNGEFITVYLTLPEGYNIADIILETVKLDGISAAWSEIQDGVHMAKFDRATVKDTLTNEPDYETAPKFYDITLTVTGKLTDGTPFKGTDTITVLKK